MFPYQFADLLKGWLAESEHPGITQVRTSAEVGWWEQPIGVALTLSDGWTFILQTVGAAPDGGNANRDPNYPPPAVPEGTWEEDDGYRQARKVFERAQAGYVGVKSRRPQAPPQALIRQALKVTEGAGHGHVSSVEVREKTGSLKVVFADGSTVYGMAAGYVAPGEAKMAHAAHAVPADWRKEMTNVS